MEVTDADLATGLKKGDRLAAEAIVDRYYKTIYRYLRRMGNDHQLSEELTQQTFAQVWQKIGTLRKAHSLRAWLYRIGYNAAAAHWRKHKRKNTVALGEHDVECNQPTGLQSLEKDEEVLLLQQAVNRLSPKLQQTIVLHYLEQLTIAEGAIAAGIRPGTFRSRLSRGLKQLRNDLDSNIG